MRKKQTVKKGVAYLLSAAMVLTGIYLPRGGIKREASAAVEVPAPVVSLDFDSGTVAGGTYTEDGNAYTLTDSTITTNPDDSSGKVYYNGGASTGFLQSGKIFADKSFSDGISIRMKVRPDTQANDWNFLFGLGYNDNGWNVVDGTIGFITREWTTAYYEAYFPGGNWQPGNALGGSETVNAYDYFLKADNCSKWYDLAYVYGKDGNFSIYVDGVLTIKYAATSGFDAVFDNIGGNNNAIFSLGGNVFTGTSTAETDLKRCDAYYDDVQVYNKTLTQEQVYYLATGKSSSADKSALDTAIATAEKILPERYTEASATAFIEKLNAAKTVKNDVDAEQSAVDAAVTALKTAQSALVLKSIDLTADLVLDSDMSTATSVVDKAKKEITAGGYAIKALGSSSIGEGYIQSSTTGVAQGAGVSLDKSVLDGVSLSKGLTFNIQWKFSTAPPSDWWDLISIVNASGAYLMRNTVGFIGFVGKDNVYPGVDCKNGFAWDSCKSYGTDTVKNLTVTIDNTGFRMYVDGVLACEKTDMSLYDFGSAFANAANIYIGYAVLTGDGDLQGQLHGLQVYHRALNAAEVDKLATAGTGASFGISSTEVSVQKGSTQSVELKSGVTPANTTIKNAVSGDSTIAAAAVKNGKLEITGVSAGKTTVTVNSSYGQSAACAVTVYTEPVAVTGITLNKQIASVEEGGTLTLIATVSPEDAVNKSVTWKSDNEAVATVDGTGKVTAIKAGTATITATSKEKPTLSASCKVTVTEQSSFDDSNTGGGTVTDESKLGTYRSDLAYKRASVHDPSVVQDPKTKRYYIFGSHCAWAWSDDLENWTTFTNNITEGDGGTAHTIFKDEIAWCKKANSSYTVTGNLWAPDVIWDASYKNANGTTGAWLMYMSINGPDWNSTISLLTSDRLDGNWTYVGPVIQSGMTKGYGPTFDYQKVTGGTDVTRYTGNVSKGGNPTLEAHAIDPCVLYDGNGDLWMAYGSWSGGISMIKLDKETGLRDYNTSYANTNNAAGADGLISDPYTGYKIAGGTAVSGEGTYIKKIGSYYYMFLSYGGYSPEGGYNMRVFRASDIKGPYKDVANKDARTVLNSKAGDTAGTTGMRLMSYYKWNFADYGYTAQGHNSAAVDGESGKAFVIYHNKYNDGTAAHEVRVHQLLTNEDGWILAAPFEYAGETVKESGYTQSAIAGDYGIMLQKQNIDHAKLECAVEQKITLEAGTGSASTGYTGNITGDLTGTWTSKANSPYVTLKIGSTTYKGVFCEGVFDETDVRTMTFTAVGDNQECLWGYRAKDPTVAIRMTIDKVIKIPDTVVTDLPLPETGVGGSKITWKSNSVAIGDDGSIPHLFDDDSKVSMTATITNNGYEYSKVYEFTVLGNTKLSAESDVAIKSFYTDKELDLSVLQQGKCPSFANPFHYTHEDISGGVSISFDVVRTAASDRLSNLVSFNNKLGKMYFTGGSYLGYNDFNDHFMDANLNTGFVAGTDYLADNAKVTIKIEITSKGFTVYKNGIKAYSSADVKLGTTPGGYSANNPEITMLSWIKTAPELNFGSGNFWGDLIFKGKVSNVVCSYKQAEIDVNGGGSSSLAGIYTQDFEDMRDISTEWQSTNASDKLSLGNAGDEHGKYMLYDFTGDTSTNSRGAHSYFGENVTWPENYILEYDMLLKTGNNQESQVAILTSNAAYVSNNENYGLSTGYVVKLTTTNSETWTINGDSSKTVTIPKSAWVHMEVTGKTNSTAAHLKITNGDVTLFDGDVVATDTGTVKGMYILAGRYQATYKVDNIAVKEQGVEYANRTAYDKLLARAEQYAAAQEKSPIYSAGSFQKLVGTIAIAKSTVTGTSTQDVLDAQAAALEAAINGLERLSYTVTVADAANGTVTGLAAGGKYFSGDSMSLTATPDSGYAFGGWKIGDEVVSENTTYSTMVTGNIAITPVFKKDSESSGSGSVPGSGSESGSGAEPSEQDKKLMEGLIAEYLFNGDLTDSKNPSKVAEIIAADDDNESKIAKDANRGNVMEMRGTWQATGYLKFDRDYVDKISDAFTVTMWAKAGNSKAGEDGMAAANSSLFNFKTTQDSWSADPYTYGFVSLDASLHPWINDGKDHWVDRPKNDEVLNLSADKWQQVTMCIDGANNKIIMYVDGVLTETISALGAGTCAELLQSIKDNTTEIQIGTFLPWWNVWDFRGYVDDVRMYNRVLTADDVSALYAKGADKSVIVDTTQKDYTLSYSSTVSNASVSVTKNGSAFASGSKVVISDQIKLSIAPEKGYTFAEAPVVTADNATVNVAEVKDGVYTYYILNFKATTKLKVSGAAVSVQYTVSIAGGAAPADAALSLSTSSATADGTVQLVVTPAEGRRIVSASVEIEGSTCTVSEPEKGANGIWIFTLSAFKGNTVVKNVAAETIEAKVTESGTNTALNIGAANLGETDFADKDVADSILDAVINKDKINAIIDEDTGKEIAKVEIDDVIAEINTAINDSSNVNVFIEVNEETDLDETTENTVNTTLLKELEKQAEQSTSNTVTASKVAIPLDISFYASVSGVKKNVKISIKDTGSKEMTIKMAVPSHIEKEADSVKRLYYAIRFHDGEQKIIPCTYDKASNTVTFKSSKFSTYVLCYVDTTEKKESGGNVNPGGGSGSGGASGGGGASVGASAPTATPSASPTVSPSSEPTVPAPGTPTEPTVSVPTVQPSEEPPAVTPTPEETQQPSDEDNQTTPSKAVKKGDKVVVKSLKYTVTSVGKTRTVKCTGINSKAKNKMKSVVIPASVKISGKKYKVTEIAKNALKGNKKITKVTIGKNISKIGKNAFKGCSNLKNIVIKSKKLKAKKTGSNAFKGINSKATAKVPKGKIKSYKKLLRSKGAGKKVKVK